MINLPDRCQRQIGRVAHRAFEGGKRRIERVAPLRQGKPTVAIRSDPVGSGPMLAPIGTPRTPEGKCFFLMHFGEIVVRGTSSAVR